MSYEGQAEWLLVYVGMIACGNLEISWCHNE